MQSEHLQSAPPEKISSRLSVGLISVVFILNATILAYAVHRAVPRDHAPDPLNPMNTVAVADNDQISGASSPQRVEMQPVVSDIVLPSQPEISAMYVQHCAACHGVDGRGRGPAAEQLYPKPRDFVESPFRFASSAGERDQIIAALERTISQGVPRSAMPGFQGVLSESQIAGLARHVLTLREEKSDVASGEYHVDIGRHPPFTTAMVARGRELYTSLGCITCHGAQGHGDGPGSYGLFDSTNRPVRPADLATGLFKSGQTPESIAHTILAGVPGTPMTPYEQMVIQTRADGTRDASDVWSLVAFIQSLSPKPQPPGIASGAEISIADAVDEAMLSDPAHVAWVGVDETIISLRPLWQRPNLTNSLSIRIVRTKKQLGICLDWQDDSIDLAHDIASFPDGAAIMFALGEEVPALPMGVEVEEHTPKEPVNIWHWRADRQYEAVYSAARSVADARERTDSWYLFSGTDEARVPSQPTFNSPMSYEEAARDARYFTAGAVGNVSAEQSLAPRAVLEGNALGFGTLTLQSDSSQATNATAAWSYGRWRVVIVRDLNTSDSQDIQFRTEARIPFAFAVWNGSEGDRAGVKMISGWHWLVINDAAASDREE